MVNNKHYQSTIECGCGDYTHRLGRAKMPTGYALVRDADRMFFFWLCLSDGVESVTDWNKWKIYRGAHADAQKETVE